MTQVHKHSVARQVDKRDKVPRPGDSGIQPTSLSDPEAGFAVQFCQLIQEALSIKCCDRVAQLIWSSSIEPSKCARFEISYRHSGGPCLVLVVDGEWVGSHGWARSHTHGLVLANAACCALLVLAVCLLPSLSVICEETSLRIRYLARATLAVEFQLLWFACLIC